MTKTTPLKLVAEARRAKDLMMAAYASNPSRCLSLLSSFRNFIARTILICFNRNKITALLVGVAAFSAQYGSHYV